VGLNCRSQVIFFFGSWEFVTAFVDAPPPATRAEIVTCNLVAFWWLACGVTLMYDIREREQSEGKLKRF